jgi:ArsR family transcriptional regulator
VAAGRIGEVLEVPGATLSFHLKELARAGLVSSRQEKQFIYYAVDFERMAELMTYLTQNCCQGMPQECLIVVETALGRCCPPSKSKPRKPKLKRSRS